MPPDAADAEFQFDWSWYHVHCTRGFTVNLVTSAVCQCVVRPRGLRRFFGHATTKIYGRFHPIIRLYLIKNDPGDEEVSLTDSCETLRNLVAQVDELLKKRREKLESSQHLHKFYEDVDNEDEWIGKHLVISELLELILYCSIS